MQNTKHVQIPAALKERMSESLDRYHVFFFSAPCGCGKTTVAGYYLRGKKTYTITDGDTDFLKRIVEGRYEAVLADDLQDMRSEETQAMLCSLLDTNSKLLILLLSRGKLPGWLIPYHLSGMLQLIEIQDLLFDAAAVSGLLTSCGVKTDQKQLAAIQRDIKGYPLSVALLGKMLAQAGAYGPDVLELCRHVTFTYLNEAVLKRYCAEERQLLLSLSLFEPFDAGLCDCLSNGTHAGAFLAGIRSDSNMLSQDTGSQFRFWPIFRLFLTAQLQTVMSVSEQKALYTKAADYYAQRGEPARALEYYSKAGCYDMVSQLLVDNARLHPGVGHFRELQDYYFSLPDAEILRSPELMRAMSMLCAMCLDYEASERWYSELEACTERLRKAGEDYKSAEGMKAYLDIGLPQRGSDGLVRVIASVFRVMSEKNIHVPSFSVTSLLPSIMNGGKDFCEWSKRDDFLYATMRIPVEAVLGSDGVGLADCAICESKFEKGEDTAKPLRKLMERIGEIQSRGTPDIEFAALGLYARIQIAQGKASAAYETVRTLRDKFSLQGQHRFLPNLDAMLCRISLCLADTDAAETWLLEKAPKNEARLWAMWRYQYMTRAMVQALFGEYEDALLLLARLKPYCEKCGRVMDGIHIHLLSAILMERLEDEAWQEELATALKTCADYGFVRPAAFYGAALLPLLLKYDGAERSFFADRLIPAVRVQALLYPRFLRPAAHQTERLSPAELQVLRLLCQNLSNQEIGEILNISLSTVKTHVTHILQKLGAKRRAEAKELAFKLRIVQL